MDAACRKIQELVESAGKEGMIFYAELGQWEVGKSKIEDVVEKLVDKVNKRKKVSTH